MREQLLVKFQQLVEICLETGNYSKISATTLFLLKNIITSHALSLHISIQSDAFIHETMLRINRIISSKMGFSPYKGEMINQIKLIEILMQKGKGEIPKKFIKNAIRLYFEVEKISIPQLESDLYNESKKTVYGGFLSRFNKSREESPIQKLIIYELSSRERNLRAQVEKGGKNDAFMELQKLAGLKASITTNNSKKLRVTANLSNEQRYIWFQAQSKVFPILGLSLLLITLSLLLMLQLALNLELLTSLGTFLLIFSGSAAISFYLYFVLKQKMVIN